MDTIDTGIKLAGFFVDLFERSQGKKISRQNCLRACYLETLNNLSLLQTVSEKALETAGIFTPSFVAIVNSLEIEFTALILFTDDDENEKNPDVYSLIKKRGKILVDGLNEKNRQNVQKWKYENILEAMYFVVTKIAVLKKLCSTNGDIKELLSKLRLPVRIKNIEDRLTIIEKHLKTLVLH
jgi:hypothetical protein